MYSKEEIKKLHIDFWELFKKRCAVHPDLEHKKKNFMLHRTKIRGVAFRFDVDRKNATVMLELHHKNEDTRIKAYEIVERYKAIMESGFENGLIWEYFFQREDSGQEVCRIYKQLKNVDIHNRNQWPDIYNFFIENMLRLEENFSEISEILREELQG